MTSKLNEDEEVLVEIVGQKLFLKIRERLGGFQIYIQKAESLVTHKDIKKLIDEGKSKRTICRELSLSYSQYNRLVKKAIKK